MTLLVTHAPRARLSGAASCSYVLRISVPVFQPFPGHRYAPDRAPLNRVIAPPYDVVDDRERQELASRSPYNAIHVELPLPDEARQIDRYAHAAELLSTWQAELALVRDDAPCFYLYKMRFSDELGDRRETTGVVGALGVDVAGGSEVLPHEQTMPKPKGDRLDLLRATRMNISPIWGLSLAKGLSQAFDAAIAGRAPEMSATDDDGVVHELWAVRDDGAIANIARLVESTPIVIADGHHRYETARYYQDERRSAGETSGSHDLVMALVVELSEDELSVQGIHRLVSGLPEEFDVLHALGEFFEISEGPDDPSQLTKAMLTSGSIGGVLGDQLFLLKPKPIVEQNAKAALDSSRLDVALEALPAHELVYQHGVNAIIEAVQSGDAQVGFVMRPATVAQIADTAHSGKRMPPKTTFFTPKPRTGMVFRSLD
jgi:uncharacterized protein (DUF1015 family)